MAYVYGLIVIGLFFLALNYFTSLSHSEKFSVIAIVLSLILIAVMFNEYSKNESENTLDVAMRFNQNKTVVCDGVEVNSSSYTLSTGTYTFIGKTETPNYGKMISVSTCK